MSTRSAIGHYTTGKNWQARYCHSDGYPSGVGQTLFDEYRRAYRGNLQGLVNYIMAERVGWSAIMGYDLTLAPVWGYDNETFAPRSYTARGETSDAPNGTMITSNDTDTWIQYIYVFDVAALRMDIYEKRYSYGIKFLSSVYLEGNAPDWNALDLGIRSDNFDPRDSDYDYAADTNTYPHESGDAAPIVYHNDNRDWNAFDYVTGEEPMNIYGIAIMNDKTEITEGRPCEVCGNGVQRARFWVTNHHVCATCDSAIRDYDARVQRRYERLQNAANKIDAAAHADIDRAHKMASAIPFGQPILVGHYSEGRDRRYRNRIESTFRRGFEAMKRAERKREQAHAAANNRAVSSDDPLAVIKLKEKLAELETAHQRILDANAYIRSCNKKHYTDLTVIVPEVMRIAHCNEFAAKWALGLMLHFQDFEKNGYGTFSTTNSSAEMRRLKQRIEELSKKREVAETKGNEEIAYTNNITIILNRDENRVQIRFPGKPAANVIAGLKSRGFKWAPSSGVWQRQLTTDAQWAADHIVTTLANAQKVA